MRAILKRIKFELLEGAKNAGSVLRSYNSA